MVNNTGAGLRLTGCYCWMFFITSSSCPCMAPTLVAESVNCTFVTSAVRQYTNCNLCLARLSGGMDSHDTCEDLFHSATCCFDRCMEAVTISTSCKAWLFHSVQSSEGCQNAEWHRSQYGTRVNYNWRPSCLMGNMRAFCISMCTAE